MSKTTVCGCANPECMENGCIALRRQAVIPSVFNPVTPAHTGWICPKCNQGVAPSFARCPCSQVDTTGPGNYTLVPIPSSSGSTSMTWTEGLGWRDHNGDPLQVTPT